MFYTRIIIVSFTVGCYICKYFFNISEFSFIYPSAKKLFNNSHIDYRNYMDSNSSNFFGKLIKPCETDQLLVHTEKTFLKKKMMIITFARRIKLNVFKVNHLWNLIQTQLIIHNKIFCKSKNFLF